MFKSKKQEFFFTVLASALMVFIMGVYNTALHGGGLHWSTFLSALKGFPIEWVIGFLFVWFAVGRLAPLLAFRVAQKGDRPIFIILCIQTFTVCFMVPFMSLVGCIESGIMNGFTDEFILTWLETVFKNFIMAYPLQVFVVGPFCRVVFGINKRKKPEANAPKATDETVEK